ncbi:MAG: PCMD domain-containing protein [Muribaculaceae bacterium]|nr:PCMD domain-containing protein [Muribaculaceae bacterium]
MIKRFCHILAVICVIAGLSGCIKNNIPYPRIQANFQTFVLAEENAAVTIDSTTCNISIVLSESSDVYGVNVGSYTLTPGAKIVGDSLTGHPIDLSSPLTVTLKLYQEYQWIISATQNIERYFSVAGQVGASIIDAAAHRVIVTVPESVNTSEIKVLTCKLGSVVATTTPDIEGETIDLSRPYSVKVTAFGRTEVWTIYAETTEATVTTESVDAWTRVAWVYGQAEEGKNNGFQYRRGDSDQWIDVPQEWISTDGGSFRARLIHLQPQTEYAARAYSDNEYASELVFTTGREVQVPNSNFADWWLNGKVWCPWPENGEQYWDTGNRGATTLGPSNSVPTDDTPTGHGKAAMLETKFVGIGALGKLAAGNIFAGSYVKTDGTNGILSFGRPFTQRPTKLKGYLKYNCTTISNSSAGYEYLKGRPDTCIVWTALIDSEEPFEIRTNPKNQHLFDPNGDYCIAYGNIQYGHSVDEYIQFEFDIDYKSTSRVPNYILIVASASKYGDYFTGGNGSILYVTDLELEYDY